MLGGGGKFISVSQRSLQNLEEISSQTKTLILKLAISILVIRHLSESTVLKRIATRYPRWNTPAMEAASSYEDVKDWFQFQFGCAISLGTVWAGPV